MNDWYLERQLHSFKDRVRGAHAEDIYGDQMNLVLNVLRNDESFKDVVAYINTLADPKDSRSWAGCLGYE